MAKFNLDRLLQHQGFGTRRACRQLLAQGRVAIDGVICRDADGFLSALPHAIVVDGVAWPYRKFASILLHKPAGYECSHQPQYHPSVFTLLPAPLRERGIQCVGRLDQDTTGLLLMSDNGDFIHRYSSPKKELGKVYEVTAKHPVADAHIEALCKGVLMHDEIEPSIAQACERIDSHRLRLTITEGKYHQVKRMIAAVGNRVEALHRTAVAEFTLPDDLVAGQWRWIDG